MTTVTTVTRRRALALGAAAAVTAPAMPTAAAFDDAAPGSDDAELFALIAEAAQIRRQSADAVEQLELAEEAALAAPAVAALSAAVGALADREQAVYGAIRETPARTPAGLAAKLRFAWSWLSMDDRVAGPGEEVLQPGPETLWSAMQDAERMAAR